MEIFAERCPWYIAGPLLGLCVVGMLWSTNRPLGATGGFIDLVAWLRNVAKPPGWTIAFLAGILVGGFVSGLTGGPRGLDPGFLFLEARFGSDFGPLPRMVLLLGAGALMGFGVRTAGGCTSGHGICGSSLGAPASLISTAVFMATAILTANLLAIVVGGPA